MTDVSTENAAVIIPAFNEAAVIQSVVKEVLAEFSRCIVIDDGSSDDTGHEGAMGGAKVVRHVVNLGQGAALQTGLLAALMTPEVQWIVTFDADGQHRVEDALALLKRAEGGDVDIVLGTRFAVGGGSEAGFVKRGLLRLAVVYSRASTGVRLSDTHNGLRAISRGLAERLELKEPRMGHASELIKEIGRLDARWAEVPVNVRYTDYSRKKGQPMMNAINIFVDSLFRR